MCFQNPPKPPTLPFCIHHNPLHKIPGAEVLHISCLFCFVLVKGNWTVCIIVWVFLWQKIRFHLWSKKKRKPWQILQSIRDNESWKDYSNITSNGYTHFCLLHFVKTAESICGSASSLGYRGHKLFTDLEARILNSAWHSIQSQHRVVNSSEEPTLSTCLWISQLWYT